MLFTMLRILIALLCLNVITKSLFKKRSTFYAVRKEVYLYFEIKVFRELLLVFIFFLDSDVKNVFTTSEKIVIDKLNTETWKEG